ncbi:DUF5518 domain-containing protein [Halorussus aquaticus]|uniref:DUF5518 domain-containing protein n=1 Tax=Halorussus aquaticus TaxID=2953748 RepID=A0ABD5Q2F6_9EURY|nr:DUF5518 domain-containing protein [Halorussus aquaticus]
MADPHVSLRQSIARSIGSGEFALSVLWGTVVGCLAVIVEYNLSQMLSDGHTVQYGLLVAGAVAGLLYADSWRAATEVGAFAGAIPILVLAPLAYLFGLVEFLPTLAIDGGVLIWAVGSVLLIYPALVLFGAVGGALGALVGYASKVVIGSGQQPD